MTDGKITVRFMSKVDKNGPTVTHVDGLGPCWIWTAARQRDGYGRLAKLTDAKVLEIRTIYAAGGISQQKLGERFGVTQSSISYILSRKNWAHVAA